MHPFYVKWINVKWIKWINNVPCINLMDVTSLYTNIPQEEGITTVCRASKNFHRNNPPIPTQYLKEMLSLILKDNFFQFNGKNYLQIHGTAMGTKIALLLQIFLWPILKHGFLAIASQNSQSGNDISTIFFLCGISANLI